MTRVKIKGTGIRAKSNPDKEPDFFSGKLSWVGCGAEAKIYSETKTNPSSQSHCSLSVVSNDESQVDMDTDDSEEGKEVDSTKKEEDPLSNETDLPSTPRTVVTPPLSPQTSKDGSDTRMVGWGMVSSF